MSFTDTMDVKSLVSESLKHDEKDGMGDPLMESTKVYSPEKSAAGSEALLSVPNEVGTPMKIPPVKGETSGSDSSQTATDTTQDKEHSTAGEPETNLLGTDTENDKYGQTEGTYHSQSNQELSIQPVSGKIEENSSRSDPEKSHTITANNAHGNNVSKTTELLESVTKTQESTQGEPSEMVNKENMQNVHIDESVQIASSKDQEKALDLLEDLMDDTLSKDQQSAYDGNANDKQQLVEMSAMELVKGCGENMEAEVNEIDQLQDAESKLTGSMLSSDSSSSGKRCTSDGAKEKDSLQRNVFDAFPISLASENKTHESSSSESSIGLNDNTSGKNIDRQHENEVVKKSETAEKGSTYTQLSETEFIGKDKKLKCNDSVEELKTNDSKSLRKEKSDLIEANKIHSRNNIKNKKELKQLNTVSFHNKEVKHESDILKKAKEKYNLKELRVSLHTTDVKDCGEAISSFVQNEKNATTKGPKIKQTNEQIVCENHKKDGKISSEQLIKTCESQDDTTSQNAHADQLLDNDSAKPLKKRGRRGYEDLKDSSNIDQEIISSACENLESKDEGKDLSLSTSNTMESHFDTCNPSLNDSTLLESASKGDVRKDRKGKKGKRNVRSKCEIQPKKSLIPIVPVRESKVHGEEKTETNESKSDTPDKNTTETLCDISLDSNSTSSTIQLKKYPGRSCKVRHQLPLIPLKPRKPKPPSKPKTNENLSGNELKTCAIDSSLKIKKKRKRKVKPWSWGNEKKKYKPKAKLIVEENLTELKLPSDSAVLDTCMVNDNTESSETKLDEVDSVSKFTDRTDKSINDGIVPQDIGDSSHINNFSEPNHLFVKNIEAESFDNQSIEGSKPVKNSTAKRKKKGKRLRKLKSEHKNDVVKVDKTDLEKQFVTSETDEILETCNLSVNKLLPSDQHVENETFAQDSPANTHLVENNLKSCDERSKSPKHTVGSFDNQVDIVAGSSQTNVDSEPLIEVAKRKRGRPGRPKKGEGKPKAKRKKVESLGNFLTETAISHDKETNESGLSKETLDDGALNQEQGDIIDAANFMEQVDNDLPVDNYPHVSPDSGIQSLAGSPAGNESPSSVIINVENSINSSTSTSDSKQHNDSSSKEKYPSTSCDGLVSAIDSVPVLIPELTSKKDEMSLECINSSFLNEKTVETNDFENDVQKTLEDSKTRKGSFTGDSSKDAPSCSPSKKKNRAKFLQLHKTSTLLQKGRLPTEEEKEKRLDDKFDYPEKATDTLPASPPIDLYSQHMNSFKVTLDTCERVGKSFDVLNEELNSKTIRTLHKNSSKKASKKSRSKHKGKQKQDTSTNSKNMSEKTGDLKGITESLVPESLAPESCSLSVVGSSCNAISDYSPIYHSSSVLTPVSSTLSTVAMTDTVTICTTVTKSITSVVATSSKPVEVIPTVLIHDEDAKSQETVETTPLVELGLNKTTDNIVTKETTNLQAENCSALVLKKLVPLKKKRGRSIKKKGALGLNTKTLKAKNMKSLPVKKMNLVVEKRSRGRPKGSKNKDKSLKLTEKSLPSEASGQHRDVIDCNLKVARGKRVLSPANDVNSYLFSQEKVRKNKLDDENSTRLDPSTEKASCPNFNNTMMAWRESSVLGHDNEDKKKRGPGRPRKHPKKPPPKKRNKKSLDPGALNHEIMEKDSVNPDNHSNQISMDLNAGPMDEPPVLEMFKSDDLVLLDESVKQLPKIRKSKLHPLLKKGKRGRKKGYTPKKTNEESVDIGIDDEVAEPDDLVNLTDPQPARSVSSHDSDTSGAGSSLGSKSLQVQMWMEFNKHKRRKNKQKLRYFRSKHKNIIDPVFIARVDCLIDDFPQLSISPPSETYLKVRPGEVPLPSIFKIVRINIKKKKKDKLFVFEKARPLKSKNELELGPKDKIKLARKIGDHIMDLSGVSYQQHYNLPPKKRHKLFSGLAPEDSYASAETAVKPEKRKAGRPRKTRLPSPEQSKSFSFGEVHKTKQGFQMGREATETLASFASVAAQSCQSPNTSFSPEKSSPPFSPVSPKARDFRAEKHQTEKLSHRLDSSKSDSSAINTYRNVPSHDKINETCDNGEKSKPSSCDKCSELQASSISEPFHGNTKVNSPKVVNNIHLKRKVKRLKRKYRKSKKLTKIKRKVVRTFETLTNEDSLDLDSSVRSVCSESEPLPSFHLDKRKFDSDSEEETVKEKRPKLFKKRTSETDQDDGIKVKVRKGTGSFNQKKKVYQKAGLYSDSYKDDEMTDSKPTEETYFTFDLPLHFGQHQLKNTITDFQLPFDVWWMHSNNMLPKKGDGKQYRRIRNNIYVDTRPASRYEAHSCSCRKPLDPNEKGCGEDCLNRLVYTECSADMCPCYDQCSNQNIQKHQFASGLQKFSTKDRGYGVRTSKQIKLGQLIVEYCGEVVSEQEFRRRMTEEYSQDRNHYCLNLDKGMVIDGYRKGNIARFVNHSCEPNCEMQKWTVEGVYHMCLFALRDIEPGEELVYDYNFQSFNHDAQQRCNCGSKECRGIIGGKKQWFNGQVKSAEKSNGKKTKLLKDKRKSKQKIDKLKDKNKKCLIPANQGLPTTGSNPMPPFFSYPIKPLLKKEKVFARKHSIFLVRNFDRIRGMRHDQLDQNNHKGTKADADYIKGTHFTKRDVFIAQLTALKTSRSMKTRRLTVAEEDTEVGKMARIAGVCKEIYSSITSAKDADGNFLATDLYHLPSKKKHPRYYQVIDEPIDLTMMQKKILSGAYDCVEMFEKDMLKLFQNVEIYCGKRSEMGDKIQALRDVFSNAKREGMTQIQELLGPESQPDIQSGALSDVDMQVATPTASVSSESDLSETSDNKVEWMPGEDDEEEIIRCICGIYKDEGLMIQCDKCYIWQHTDCMRVKGDVRNYLCEQCDPRPINKEVELVPNSDGEADASGDGNRYFMTLMRDDMQIRLGSCVYVMKENQSRRNSYKKSGGLDKDKMDIFRIERMWKNKKGEKFAFGHMYILPHETFHEPNRKFFPNEVFRTPLYEMFHLESITGYCCVLDLLTYCKGKPRGYRDEDLYICEYRMDKTLHLFYKISSKQRCSVNTRSYCFEMYEKRLNPKRTYSPHEVPEAYKRNWREKSSGSVEETVQEKKPVSDEEEDVPLVKVKIERRKEKRERVNRILDTLSKGKLSPSKKRTDLTYLLTDCL